MTSDSSGPNGSPVGFTRYPAMRAFLSALFAAGVSMACAGGLDIVAFERAPFLFAVILLFAFVGGLLQERMAKNF